MFGRPIVNNWFSQGYHILSEFGVTARTSIVTNDGRYPLRAPFLRKGMFGLSSVVYASKYHSDCLIQGLS